METKEYLGDGVYAHFNGHHIILSSKSVLGSSNTIFLEPSVIVALLAFYGDTGGRTVADAKKLGAKLRGMMDKTLGE